MTHPMHYLLLILANMCFAIGFVVFSSEDVHEYRHILNQYDFVIIGSGSSGSVLANRLSEVPEWKILLLEAGKRPSKIVDIPVIAPALQFTDYNWGYRMERTANVCLGMVDQKCTWPRGKGLGGSTLINYMIYTRGNEADFNRWANQGNPGWSYDEILPYYKKSERSTLRKQDDDYHNRRGLLSVADIPFRTRILESFIEAGIERGHPFVDYNGRTQEGFSYIQSNTKNGRRHSGYSAFIQPAERRNNLHILTESRATKILIDTVTKSAYGVEFVKNRKYHKVNVTKEVIVSAGALLSPQLLMLSGIGPRQHLESHEIYVHKDLPGVGQNLHDHITYTGLVFLLNETVASLQESVEDVGQILNWVLFGQGPLTSLGGVEGIGYIHTNVSDTQQPDMELLFVTGSMNTDRGRVYRKTFGISDEIYNAVWKPLEGRSVWTIFPMLLFPKSIGHLELKSKNPYHWPKFYGNYLSDPGNLDVKSFIKAIKEIIEISKTKPFRKYGSTLHDIAVPGCGQYEFNTDPYWECTIRHLTTTLHHQVGTCKMGPKEDPMAVVDNKGRVYGVQNLRVVDTSVIPFAIAAHTSAPAYMIGEKISDEIKKDWNIFI